MRPLSVRSMFVGGTAVFVFLLLGACGRSTPATPSAEEPSATPGSGFPTSLPTSLPTLPASTATQRPAQASSPTASPSPTLSSTPSPTPQGCSDRAEFVGDLTIPDNTEIEAGKAFTKRWRLRNNGTCPWTGEYAVEFQDGERMGGPERVNLTTTVAPGGTLDVSLDLVAPQSPGTYKGNWRLRNPAGTSFGTGADGRWPFYVQIVVTSPTEQIQLGTPDWFDTFNTAANWVLLNTPETRFTLQTGSLALESFNPGTMDEWAFAIGPRPKDFYLELVATTPAQCSGQDRYGFIFRAPDPTRGYVLSFACNGSYRLYRWDNGTFVSLKSWSNSSLILSGPNQTNRLGVWAAGDQLKLYANRKLLAVVTDNTYLEGHFGLMVGAAATSNFRVLIEEVAYWLNP